MKRTVLTPEELGALRAVPVLDGMPNKVGLALTMLGLGQIDIIEETGFTQGFVSDVVRGKVKNLSIESARKFAEFFGCNIEDLFPAREAVA